MTLRSHSPKPPKLKICKVCKCNFLAPAGLQRARVCGQVCALTFAKSARAKAEKVRLVKENRETKKALEKYKTPTQWEKECREIVQEIARLRDRHDGCISCHMGPNYGGQWHGSHFRPAGNNAAVQFHLWNIHKACAQCNLFKGGNISEYRPRLVEKIGADRVAWLESQTQQVKTDVDYCIRFKAVMGKRLRRMKKQIGRRE